MAFESFSITSLFPEQVNFIPVIKWAAPNSLLQMHDGRNLHVSDLTADERNFIEREVISRIFAILLASASLLNAMGNLALSGVAFLSYSFSIVFSDSETCERIFNIFTQKLENTASSLLVGTGVFYAWY